jgi:ribosomal protein L11 methyltransferase
MHTIRLNFTETESKNLNDEQAFCLAEALVDNALSCSAVREGRKHTGPWTLEWIFESQPDLNDIQSRLELQIVAHGLPQIPLKAEKFISEKTPEENWLEKAYHEFPPFSVGPFFIYGSHYQGPLPQGQMGLQIDAATAFGSGEHETTKGCLQAMLDLKGKGICPWNTLDMGTGSGILAIAAWKLWKSPVLAVDNDAESVRVTERHADMNGVALTKGSLSAACGDGFRTPEVDAQKPYELILMNILAGPVIEMAPAAIRVLDDNGYIVLSGMLVEQADLVTAAYEGIGLTFKKRYDIGEWSTLVLHKSRQK